MTENNEEVEVGGSFLDSKFWRITMIVTAVFLIFIGPTYIPYLLAETLKVDYVASIVIGAVLFILGIIVMLFLVRKKIIT